MPTIKNPHNPFSRSDSMGREPATNAMTTRTHIIAATTNALAHFCVMIDFLCQSVRLSKIATCVGNRRTETVLPTYRSYQYRLRAAGPSLGLCRTFGRLGENAHLIRPGEPIPRQALENCRAALGQIIRLCTVRFDIVQFPILFVRSSRD
jgi:hypothetical protein